MASKIILFLLSFTLLSCIKKEPSKVDEDFQQDFQYAIEAVKDYHAYRGVLYDYVLARFYFSENYLAKLTGIEGTFVFSEPPYYPHENYLHDIKEWKKWYNQNKYTITKEYSDSITNSTWDGYVWWHANDNDLSEFRLEIFHTEENMEQQVNNDTLLISIYSDSLLYPFGVHSEVEGFLSNFHKDALVSKSKAIRKGVYILSLKYQNSTVDILNAEIFRGVHNNIKILNANILDKEIKTNKGISIEMSKQDFCEKFRYIDTQLMRTIKVFQISSIFDSTCHTYIFDEKDILTKIEIERRYH